MSRGPGPRLAAAAAALVLLASAGCGRREVEPAQVTVELERQEVQERLRFHGTLEALDETPVKSPFDSTLLRRVDHGTRVLKGQVVAEVDAVPHERELEVLLAELEEAQGNRELSVFQLEEDRAELDLAERKATRKLRRAEVALDALRRGRDVVRIARLELGVDTARRTLARLEEDLEVQRPHLEKGFVSAQEIQELEGRIEQLRYSIEGDTLRLEVLKQGPTRDRLADAELAVEVARAELSEARARRPGRLEVARARVERARQQIEELEEQIADRREKIAACSMVAPAEGTFLVSRESLWGMKVEVGARAWSMIPVGYVAEGGACEVVFDVAESHQHLLEVGERITFETVADRRRSFPAEITEVSRVARFDAEDPVGVRWLEARAAFVLEGAGAASVKPGLNVEITLGAGPPEEVWALPGRALVGDGVLLPGGARRPVRLGRVGLEFVEVVEGLLPGERVLLPGAVDLEERAVAARRGALRETYEESGELVAESQEILFNNGSDAWRTKITWLEEEGAEVEPGQVCVKLDPGDLENEVEEAQEDLDLARAAMDKVRAEGEAARVASEEERAVLAKTLAFQEANLRLLEAGTAPEEVARKRANLDALRVDEAAAEEKLALTRKMEERGFSGAREVAELEEGWRKARAEVKVAELELALAEQGATPRELELARIDVEDARQNLSAAEAAAARREEKLVIEVAAAAAKVRAQEKNLVRRQAQVEALQLRASRPGTLIYRKHRNDNGERVPFEVGSFARRGEGVVAVADLSGAKVEGLVSEEVAWRVKAGQPARFWLPSFPEEQFEAEVESLGHLPEPIPDAQVEQGLRVTLAVKERSARLQPGVQVRFEVELARYPDAVLVPLASVRERGGEDFVRMADGAVRRVEVLGRDQEHAALAAGVEEGEVVRVP